MRKQKLFIAYLAVLHLLIALLVVRTDAYQMLLRYVGVPPTEGSTFQRDVLAFQLRQQPFIPNNAVHLLGDSHIQGLYLNDFCPNAVNLGIGGDTTSGLLARMPYYSSLSNASAVVLLIGFNDLRYRRNIQIIEQYQQILAQLPLKTRKLVVAIPPPASTFADVEVAQRVQQLNLALQKLAVGAAQTEFIAGTWQTLPVIEADSLLLTDKIHLAPSGYRVLRSQLQQALAEACYE
jgi:lysophospholipase L1-like esterase